MTRMITYTILSVTIAILGLIHGAVWVGTILPNGHDFLYTANGLRYWGTTNRNLAIPLYQLPHVSIIEVNWRPDTQAYAIASDATSISIVDFHGNEYRIYYPEDIARIGFYAPRWSPDGTMALIYATTLNEPRTTNVYLTDIGITQSNGELQFIAEGPPITSRNRIETKWSPDGTRILYNYREDRTIVYIYNLNDNVTIRHELNALNGSIHWWDNDHLAFVSSDGIYTFNLDTHTTNILWNIASVSTSEFNGWITSPDHTRLTFRGQLYRVDPQNVQIEHINDQWGYNWSPNSRYFVRSELRTGWVNGYEYTYSELLLYDRNGNFLRPIDESSHNFDLTWRPQ